MRFIARSRSTRRRFSSIATFESLESRVMLAFSPTANEQYMLELLNRMRENPAAELGFLTSSLSGEARSADPDVDDALDFFNVSGPTLQSQWNSLVAAQPLAWNESLYNAATGHNQVLIAHDTQSHQVIDGAFVEPNLSSRVQNAGYSNATTFGENVYSYSDTVFFGHAGFAIDWGGTSATGGIQPGAGHRVNMMNNSYREVGIAITPESNPNTDVGPLVITQDLGTRTGLAGKSYLLGVVYDDTTGNDFYTPGEGLGGVTITATPLSGSPTPIVTTTMSAGGYQLLLTAGVHYSVSFTGPGLSSVITYPDLTIGSTNLKIDLKAEDTILYPDLIGTIDVLPLPITVAPNENTSVNVVVRNIGDGDVNRAINFRLYASTDSVFNSNGDTVLVTLNNRSVDVPAGGQQTIGLPFTVPANFIGDYNLFVVVDSSNLVVELNENNNVGTTTEFLTVVRPDLSGTLDGAALPANSTPGSAASVNVIVNNPGTTPAVGAIAIKLFASKDNTLSTTGANADKLVGTLTGQQIDIDPGGSATLPFNFTVPAGLFGTYNFFAQIDSANGVLESDESNNTAFLAGALNVLGAFGTIGGKPNNSLIVTDPDGTRVTFSLAGPGIASLVPVGNGYDVIITGTTEKSNVTVTTKKSKTPGDDGAVVIHDLTTNSRIGKITASAADLTGWINIGGGLLGLQLRNVISHNQIAVGSRFLPADATAFNFRSVADLTINSQMPIKSITATQWRNTDNVHDEVNAPWIGAVTTTGDKADITNTGVFQADFNLSGVGAPKGMTLGKATIAGTLSGGVWTFTAGSAGAISAGAIGPIFGFLAPGVITSITTTKGNLGGEMFAAAVGAIKVKANVQDLGLTLSPATATSVSLTSLAALGMFNSYIDSSGSLGSFTLNQIEDSTIFAGVARTVSLVELPSNIAQLAAPTAFISGLTVKGIPGQTATASFKRSVIAAGVLNKVSLKVVDTAGTAAFGFAADVIKSLTRTGAAPVSNQTAPDTDIENQFEIRVL